MNQILLEKLSYYLNNNSKCININQVKKVAKGGIPEVVSINYLLKEYLEYDYDYLKILNELNNNDYMNNPYYKNIKLPNKKYNNSQFKIDKYDPYELFVMDDFKENNNEILPQIGYFKRPFYYPAIYENNRLWMSITPNEINTMKNDINDSFGNVLVIGVGMLYFPYMISLKEDVKSITVIDNNQDIINLAKDIILPQFNNKEKIKIINSDAFSFLDNLNEHYDYIYIDIWHDVSDGLPLYKKLKKYEEKYPKSIFRYWIYNTMKYYL